MESSIYFEYLVILGYLFMLIAVGWGMRKLNSDVSDYFRNGCRGTWWLVGSSTFMAAFSAWTFTGAAGVAFQAGWSVSIIYLANALAFFINYLFLAKWFRQLRVITVPDVIRLRFDGLTEQFYSYFSVVIQLLHAGLWLYGLAIFSSSVFGFNIQQVIIGIGFIVLFYSLTGGSWAVMATDFLQSLILLPLTILVAVLCLVELGGIGGLFAAIQSADLSRDFAVFNSPDRFEMGKFSVFWACAIVLNHVIVYNSVNSSVRYFAVKDGDAARKAALLACILMLVGSFLWIIPPMAARLLIPEVVLATQVSEPAEAAYALISLELLPNGLIGLMVVAMFAATMSSLDTGLNRNAAIFTQNIYPSLCRWMKRKPVEEGKRLIVGRLFTLALGFGIILLALYFSRAGGKGVFDFMLEIGAVLGVPMTVPMVLCLFVRKVPAWSAIAAAGGTMIPSLIGYFSPALFGEAWSFQTKVFVNLGSGTFFFLATTAFWQSTSVEYRRQTDRFFERMHRPVDFEKEVGQANDLTQLVFLGRFGLAAGLFIALLLLLPNSFADRIGILGVSLIVSVISLLLLKAGKRSMKYDS